MLPVGVDVLTSSRIGLPLSAHSPVVWPYVFPTAALVMMALHSLVFMGGYIMVGPISISDAGGLSRCQLE